MVSQAYSGMPRYVLAFLHRPKAALVTVAYGEKGLCVVVWCNSDEDRVKGQGRENLNDGNTTITLRLRLMVGIVVRSLGSGGGNTLTRG